jgi:type I restriction enzyme R subunit
VHAQAFYGVITAILDDVMDIAANVDVISDISLIVTEILDRHNMVDWQTNTDIHKKIAQDIDDMFYELEKEKGIHIDFDVIDKIIENVITVGLRRFK